MKDLITYINEGIFDEEENLNDLETKNLYESIMDMDDTDLDYVNSDLLDLFNSKSEDEWNRRWDYLRLRLLNNGEIAPKDYRGYLQKKPGRLYIRMYQASYDKTLKIIQLGKDTNGYIFGWNRGANKVILNQSRYIRFRDNYLNSKQYAGYQLYILPNDLKKSYREIIK